MFSTPGPVQADPAKLSDPTVMRQRTVALNLNALAQKDTAGTPPAIRFNLFDDVALTGTIDQTIQNPSGTVSLVGRIQDEYLSSWTLVRSGDNVIANIQTLQGLYQIRFDESGTHSVRQVDPAKFPPDGHAMVPENQPQQKDAGATPPTGGDDGTIIDVMVVYTPSARSLSGGVTAIEASIDLAVTEINTAYSNANVTQRLRLVYKGEITYTESGTSSTVLNALTGTTDGSMDSVHTLRNTYAADEVVLIAYVPDVCGIAWVPNPVASSAVYGFSVVHYTCVTGPGGNYTMGHELGHNMGLTHDLYADTFVASITPFVDYARGYVNDATGQRWRTIMAYNDKCSSQGFTCSTVQYFSNPSKTHPTTGAALGDSRADARTALNTTAPIVANWRDSSTSTTAVAKKTAYTVRNAHKVVSPYWQAGAGIFSFIAISHPSLSNMSPQVGIRVFAFDNTATLYGSTEFTVSAGATKNINITGGAATSYFGSLIFTPVASNPEKLFTTSAGVGYPDITALGFWGAVVIEGTLTGFSMEFIGDMHDSISTGTNPTRSVTSGVN
jgi:hypothetical protein